MSDNNLDLSQENILKRLKSLKPAREAAESDPAYDEEEWERLKRELVDENVRSATCAPKRHWQTVVKRSGKWNETLAALELGLGSGFTAVLIGPRATGKTQIGVELIRNQAGTSRRYCTAAEFFLDLKSTFKSRDRTEADVMEQYRAYKLLVIDEASKRVGSAWEETLFFELLNKRHGDKSDTLLISNQGLDDVVTSFGESIITRIKQTGGIVDCNWEGFQT